jgi:DNA-binding NtrC family response regulator
VHAGAGRSPQNGKRSVTKTVSVLIVAADSLTRQVTANGIAMYGHEPVTARDGAAALAILAERRISVLVVDADLEGETSGLALAKEARRLHPRIDVIYASRAPQRILESAKVKGAPVIRAPFQPQQIVGIISELRYRMPSDGIDRRAA